MPAHPPSAIPSLLRLLVRRVLATPSAVLLKLQPLGHLPLVLRRVVVPPLALGAREMMMSAHVWLVQFAYSASASTQPTHRVRCMKFVDNQPLLDNLGDGAGPHGATALPESQTASPFSKRHRRDQLHADRHVVPGITISTPSGSVATPVTSVVRR